MCLLPVPPFPPGRNPPNPNVSQITCYQLHEDVKNLQIWRQSEFGLCKYYKRYYIIKLATFWQFVPKIGHFNRFWKLGTYMVKSVANTKVADLDEAKFHTSFVSRLWVVWSLFWFWNWIWSNIYVDDRWKPYCYIIRLITSFSNFWWFHKI